MFRTGAFGDTVRRATGHTSGSALRWVCGGETGLLVNPPDRGGGCGGGGRFGCAGVLRVAEARSWGAGLRPAMGADRISSSTKGLRPVGCPAGGIQAAEQLFG